MLAAYLQYWRINLLTFLEYRANFVMWALFTVVYHGTALLALVVTMQNFPSMNGWNVREVFFLYSLWMLGQEFHNAVFFNVVNVPDFVREGRFDRFLVRPFDTLFQVLTVPQQLFPDGLILATITFAFATMVTHVTVDALFFVLVPLVAIGGALIDFGISLLVAAASFWFIRVDTIRWVVMSLEQEFTRYPISIYQRGVRIILAFVLPFAFTNYFPATFLLHKSETALNLAPWVGVLTPAIGLLWFGVAYVVWRIGLQHYQGTGS